MALETNIRCFAGTVLRAAVPVLLGLVLISCGPARQFDPAPDHLKEAVNRDSSIPTPVTGVVMPPRPQPVAQLETYSVVVTDVPVRQLLFTLARDAEINVDIHGDIVGRVTMNAIDQTLPQILSRITKQVDLRYTLDGVNLIIMPDTPYWHNYTVGYVNLDRGSESEVTVATAVSSTGGSVDEDGDTAGEGEGNISRTTVKTNTAADFWGSLQLNLQQIVAQESVTESDEESGDPVVVNPVAGVVSVFATQRQHNQVQVYLDRVTANAKRQVLIEVTIAEVELSDTYQTGVDWTRVSDNLGTGSNGPNITQAVLGNNLGAAPFVALTYNNFDADGSGFTASVKLLEQFGDTKVLSSPRIMALNNQTSLLKVVDERVYFSLEREVVEGTDNNAEREIITSEIRTVPVGFVMSVTPQINENGTVSMNIRPTITRIIGFKVDPGPRLLADVDFDNLVPEIHVNEIESVLEVSDGQTVVLGGLMQDQEINGQDGLPGLSRIPVLGKLFSYEKDEIKKSELVIFLRPTVIRGGGTDGMANTRRSRGLWEDSRLLAVSSTGE